MLAPRKLSLAKGEIIASFLIPAIPAVPAGRGAGIPFPSSTTRSRD